MNDVSKVFTFKHSLCFNGLNDCQNVFCFVCCIGQLPIDFELQSTSSGVYITCTFLESSTTDCVAVVHQRISQLNSSGLMNIESSHKFTRSRSGDTASGCIEGVNLEDYQVGVVGGTLRMVDHPIPESKGNI